MEELEGIRLHNKKTAESGLVLWEREVRTAQLEGKVQTDLLWLFKSCAVPKDSQKGRTVTAVLILPTQGDPETLRTSSDI